MAATVPAFDDPFYTPKKFQPTTTFDWTTTELIGGPSGYYEQNPQSYFDRYIADRYKVGLGDTSPYAQYVRNQYNTTQRGFQSALAEDPNLTYQRYLNSLDTNYRQMFNRLTPRQRGEQQPQAVRWIVDL